MTKKTKFTGKSSFTKAAKGNTVKKTPKSGKVKLTAAQLGSISSTPKGFTIPD